MAKRIFARTTLAALLAIHQLLTFQSAQAFQQSASTQAETVDSLRARINAHIGQPRFAPAAWGVKIVSLDSGKTIFEHNGQKYFNPASNAKLYSAALALDRLGADFRIKTSL